MNPYHDALVRLFTTLCDQIIETMQGMPDDALNGWKTPQAHGDINTMYGLATHIAGAGEFWTLEAVGGIDLNRRRLEEFAASGSIADIRQRYDRWLEQLAELLNRVTDEELRSVYRREANSAQGVSAAEKQRAECLLHALEHTALHLGHMQVQRQLWDAEQGQAA